METIYMIILFFGPGLMVKAIDDYLYKGRKVNFNAYDYLFGVVMHGTIVFVTTIMILNQFFDWEVLSLTQLMAKMNIVNTALFYVCAAVLISLIWWFIYDKVAQPLLLRVKNCLLKKRTGTTHTKYPSVYEGIFHNPENTHERLIPVSIYQNGQYITSGTIHDFNSPNFDIMEFQLENILEVEEILEEDKLRDADDKILGYIRFEYFVPEYNLLIKFYNTRDLEKHWNQKYQK